ncbi:MAG TPA: hypothetical protein VMN39_04675, partial [Longimicrobiaceae bacterium]|nr:hypothetical protein [Longimicrobiaceae bacterium]
LIEAEIGYFLEHSPTSLELFREGMVARISDLIDEVDVLDSVAAGRVYDAIVDFLAELPDEDAEGVVEATIRFRRAVDRVVERGMDRRDLSAASTWAVVLDGVLSELADEYHVAVKPGGEVRPREYTRVETLVARARQAADRMLWSAEVDRPEIADALDRLVFSVRHRRPPPTELDFTIRSLQRQAARYRPSTLTRIGVFVLRQVLRRDRPRPLTGKAGARGGRSEQSKSRHRA